MCTQAFAFVGDGSGLTNVSDIWTGFGSDIFYNIGNLVYYYICMLSLYVTFSKLPY